MQPKERFQPAPKCKFFFALSWARDKYCDEVEHELTEAFGTLHMRSEVFCFSEYSNYYDQDLGGTVWKYLVALRPLLPAHYLVEAKLRAESIQWQMARTSETGLCRVANIDPGYLNGWQVVLSTVKNQAHRIYLGDGVFGEVTLLYRKPRFRPLPWTYPDYTNAAVIDFLNGARDEYRRQLSKRGSSS